jgi:hypothetical protein
MLPIFANAEYAHMLYAYGSCGGSATSVVQEYRRRSSMLRIPDRRVSSKVFSTLSERGALSSARVSSERARQHVEEQENILEMVQRSPTTCTRRLSTRLGVSRTRVWRTLNDDDLHPIHPQSVKSLHSLDNAMHLRLCHWLHTNHQLLPVILFSGEATFTRNEIKNTCYSHRWSHDNPHGILETNFQRRFSVSVWCGMIDDMLIGPVILDDRMTGRNYLDFLQNGLDSHSN